MAQRLAPQMGVQEAQAPETRLAHPVAAHLGQSDLAGIAHDQVLDASTAVDEQADLASELSRQLAQTPRQLDRDHLVGRNAPLGKFLEPLNLAGFQAENVAFWLLDTVSLLACEAPRAAFCAVLFSKLTSAPRRLELIRTRETVVGWKVS
ncbi:MAG: hypothetical protein AMXMBFR33_71020 [Candidatus Xenobia bacterium]